MIYKRRDFLKISGITAAGTIAMPSLLQSCKGSHLSGNISDFLDHFEVSTALLKKVISNALSKGGDYADLYFEHTLSNNSVLMDGKVNQAQSNVAYGVGVRVLKGDQTGYAFTEIITPEALMNAAGTAANIANDTGTGFPGEMKELLSPNLYPVTRSWEDTSIKDKIPFLERANEKIFALDNKVKIGRAHV